MIDDGFLQLSTFATKKENVLEVVNRWHQANYSAHNDEGYIAVEVANKEGETAERIIQVNLDEDPEEVEDYLKKDWD